MQNACDVLGIVVRNVFHQLFYPPREFGKGHEMDWQLLCEPVLFEEQFAQVGKRVISQLEEIHPKIAAECHKESAGVRGPLAVLVLLDRLRGVWIMLGSSPQQVSRVVSSESLVPPLLGSRSPVGGGSLQKFRHQICFIVLLELVQAFVEIQRLGHVPVHQGPADQLSPQFCRLVLRGNVALLVLLKEGQDLVQRGYGLLNVVSFVVQAR
mmetsp:Transcript_5976/g.12610  ORF Transcript_5976/g.12610 Transcript_5976/m.12610 type:complete len:210 (-) Transcript_5976:2607-3236(-)